MSGGNAFGRFRSLGAELIIVVIGVIIALGMESWWSGRQDSARERVHLAALQDEFGENLDSLRGNIARLENIKGAANQLLSVMVGDLPRPSHDSLVALAWEAFSFPPYEPLTTEYDDLISSGDIALLQDSELKRDLAMFMSEVEHYRRGEWQLDQWNRFIQPFLSTRMAPLDAFPAWYRAANGMPEPRSRTDWDALFASREFEGILANRVMAAQDNIDNLNRVLPPATRIRDRLLRGIRAATPRSESR